MSQAVIKIGASQFSVEPGSVVLALKPQIDKVIYPDNTQVEIENLGQLKGPKIRTLKYHAKSRYRKVTGHRSVLYRLKITEIKSVKPAS